MLIDEGFGVKVECWRTSRVLYIAEREREGDTMTDGKATSAMTLFIVRPMTRRWAEECGGWRFR